MKTVFRFFAARHLLANLLTILVFLLGLSTLVTIHRSQFPTVDLGLTVITTHYPGASPEDVELNVTNKIERELKTVTDLKLHRSISTENVSLVIAEIKPDAQDIDAVKTNIREAVGRVTDLPEAVTESPHISEKNSAKAAIIEVSLVSDIPYPELREIARRFEKKLNDVPGVGVVLRYGYRTREIFVEVSPEKIREFQIPMGEIIQAIESRNIRSSGGVLESYTSERNVVTLSQFGSPWEVGDAIVRSTFDGPQIKIKDLAIINDGFADAQIDSRVNGQPAITFRISKTETADIIRTVDMIKKLTRAESEKYGDKVSFILAEDASAPIKNSFDIVLENGLIGLLLVMVVLLFFLNLRTAFWVAMGIPLTLLGVIFLLPQFDADLNRITLVSMILVIGIIVDDAIVIAENIYRRRELGDSPVDAAVNGLAEVFQPVLTMVLTTFLAFVPLFFLPGLLGQMIYVIPLTIGLALLISVFECFVMMPAHLVPGLHKHSPEQAKKRDWFAAVKSVFSKICFYILKLRYVCMLVLIGIFLGSIYYARTSMDFILFPADGADRFFVRLELPVGTSKEANIDKVKEVEAIINKLPDNELVSYSVRLGLRVERIISTVGQNLATISVNLTPLSERGRTASEIIESLRPETDELQGFANIGFEVVSGGPPVGAPVTLRIIGADDQERQQLADSVYAFLNAVEGIKDVDRDDIEGKQQVRLNINYTKLAQLGLTVTSIAQNVRIAYDGQVVTSVRYGEEDVDFRVILKERARRRLGYLRNLAIPNNRGRLIPLKEVATLRIGPGPANSHHYNGERTITITAGVDQDLITPLEALQLVENHFDVDKNYPSTRLDAGGEAQESRESMLKLFFAFIGAVVGIYFLLILLYNSVTQPLLVLSVVPFSLTGVIIAFALHDEAIGFLALAGVIGLAGVVVNDSLILVNHLNQLRKTTQQENFLEVVAEGAANRLRPIMLTTISTVAGLLPLAYGFGGLDVFMAPLALALGYGLLFATPITLIILPCLYVIGNDIARLFKRKKAIEVHV